MSLIVNVVSYAVALLGVALVALYFYLGRRHDHWRRKAIKHLKPLPFVGSMKDMALLRKNIGVMFKEIYDKYKTEPYIGLYSFDEPVLQINDLDLVRAVLVKDFQYFTDRNFTPNENADLLGSKSLFALKGDRWKHSRNALTPSFSSGRMKDMYSIVHKFAEELSETVKRENKGQPTTMYELAARYTTDVIASCAFGIESGTMQDNRSEFRRKLRMVFDFSSIRAFIVLLAFFAPKILEIIKLRVFPKESEDYIIEVIKNTLETRKKNNIVRRDLLNSLAEIMKGEVGGVETPKQKIEMNEIDVAAHSFAFLAAGFETSATTISYALYELSKHPDIQNKLREEIQTVLTENEGSIPYDALQSMKYMDMVFQETLRKYPPVPFIDRTCSKTYKLPESDLVLEAGTSVIIPVLGIHRDPEIYPNPMEFIPERFSEENKSTRPSCSHIAFGEGPRTCVGLRFALMQTKLGLLHILKDHSVHLPESVPRELDFTPRSFLFQPMEHVKLILRRIELH